ncbi:hypothetical protein CHUAL_001952 [Chamberlinius hualienensis]
MAVMKRLFVFISPVLLAYFFWFGVKFNPDSIRGKCILVTGASSGIGEQIAYKYAQLGAKLVLTARRTQLLTKVEKKCKQLGAQLVFSVTADMGKPDDRKKVVEAVEKHLVELHYLILNHALISYGWWESTPENVTALENIMNINFVSYVDLTSMLLKKLEANDGYIGVVSSIVGKYGNPAVSHYAATKHALHGFYSSLRQEFRVRKSNVSITLAIYGVIDTEPVHKIAEDQGSSFNVSSVASSPNEAADALIKAVSARYYEFYFPFSTKVLGWLISFMPGHMEDAMTYLVYDLIESYYK